MTIEIAVWTTVITLLVIASLIGGFYAAFRVEQRRQRREKAAR